MNSHNNTFDTLADAMAMREEGIPLSAIISKYASSKEDIVEIFSLATALEGASAAALPSKEVFARMLQNLSPEKNVRSPYTLFSMFFSHNAFVPALLALLFVAGTVSFYTSHSALVAEKTSSQDLAQKGTTVATSDAALDQALNDVDAEMLALQSDTASVDNALNAQM